MGTEIIGFIIFPGIAALGWLIYWSILGTLIERVAALFGLLFGLGLGVRGMVNAYLPSIPENWNTSFLVGRFLISASFWLIITAVFGAILVALVQKGASIFGYEEPERYKN